jgi:hypothetical protein
MPVVVALFMGTFNNTYLAGAFGHFWMRYADASEAMGTRLMIAQINNPSSRATAAPSKAILDKFTGLELGYQWTPNDLQFTKVAWTVPNLVPLRLNFQHFGKVPSWEAAASNEGSFVSIFSASFLMELAPVLLLGIPFGLYQAWKRPRPLILLLAWLAAVSSLPPVFLDWGYRSTDFLRFFTASYCYAALFFGWLTGEMLSGKAGLKIRLLGGALVSGALISSIGLGVLGLMPGTLNTVKAIASTAGSLSQSDQRSQTSSDFASKEANRHIAFESLATQTGDFLFPLTKGRDRAIVIVPVDQVPETKYFPEWLKMATLSRIQLPVGWHWTNSIYSAFYREAVSRLDARAIAALDAKWVIVSNVFQSQLPPEDVQALSDRERFVPVARFQEGQYSMSIFKILP